MTRIIVLDDTRRNPELAERIDKILRTVAPLVAETTMLSLPTVVRFRLVKPAAWRHETREMHRRTLARDIAELDLPPAEVKAMRAGLKVMGVMPILVWPLVVGATQIAADGQSETICTPQTLRHAGLLAHEPYLTQMVSHELTHQLQDAATGGDGPWNTMFPNVRHIDPRGLSSLVEGHASWTDHEVTTQLYGEPVDQRQATRSLRYRLHARFPGIRHLGPSRTAYGQGSLMIRHAVSVGGVDLVNRVWKDQTLLPSQAEVADPKAWTDRIAV